MARILRVGEAAPGFGARDGDGREWSLAALRGHAFVLFFYPRDHTPGCVAEVCAFRDRDDDFAGLGIPVLGVSRDDAETHRAFGARQRVSFPLLVDTDGRMHDAFGAVMLGGFPRRVSYLVDAEGRIAEVFASQLRPAVHAQKMLDAARALAQEK